MNCQCWGFCAPQVHPVWEFWRRALSGFFWGESLRWARTSRTRPVKWSRRGESLAGEATALGRMGCVRMSLGWAAKWTGAERQEGRLAGRARPPSADSSARRAESGRAERHPPVRQAASSVFERRRLADFARTKERSPKRTRRGLDRLVQPGPGRAGSRRQNSKPLFSEVPARAVASPI